MKEIVRKRINEGLWLIQVVSRIKTKFVRDTFAKIELNVDRKLA